MADSEEIESSLYTQANNQHNHELEWEIQTRDVKQWRNENENNQCILLHHKRYHSNKWRRRVENNIMTVVNNGNDKNSNYT